MCRASHVAVFVDQQHTAVLQIGPFLERLDLGMGLHRRHLLPDFLDHLFDVAGVSQDPLQAFDHLGLVADVAFHHVHGVVKNFVDRQSNRGVNGLDTLSGRRGLFGHQKLQRVECHGHVAGEDFEELKIALAKSPRLGALHVKRADGVVVQYYRHGQGAFCPRRPLQIEGVFGRIFTQIALARRGHETRHAVVLRLCVKYPIGRFRIHTQRKQGLQPSGFGIQ